MKKKSNVNDKINLMFKNQKKILLNGKRILEKEDKIDLIAFNKEKLSSNNNSSTFKKELDNVKLKLNKKKKNKITFKDLTKGFIGATTAVLSAYTFSFAFDLAKELSIFRSSVILIVAFLIILIILYHTTFKEIKSTKLIFIRSIMLYMVSIFAVILVNMIFGLITINSTFFETYRIVASSMVIGVMGASIADILGEREK